MAKSLLELIKNKKGLQAKLGGLISGTPEASRSAAEVLANEIKEYGISIQNYLRLAIDLSDEDGKAFREAGMDGYEAALAFLSLPTKNDFSNSIMLAQAGETFKSYPGTRLLFQPVMDEVLRFSTRQDQIEKVADLVGSSRSVSGIEMISVIAESDEDAEGTWTISEGGRIPVRKIETREQAVKWFKHGSGYEFTYEFDRRASLDILTPYVARIVRRLELSKVAAATHILINGDGVHPAAPVVYQADLLPAGASANTENKINYAALLSWILSMAKKGTPMDTVIGNYDTYLMWMMLFTPTLSGNASEAGAIAAAGGPALSTGIPGLFVPIKFAISSAMPAKQLLGFIKAETLQELVEEGSQIQESETHVREQRVTYVRTETTGYKLIFGDTRSIFTTANKD